MKKALCPRCGSEDIEAIETVDNIWTFSEFSEDWILLETVPSGEKMQIYCRDCQDVVVETYDWNDVVKEESGKTKNSTRKEK